MWEVKYILNITSFPSPLFLLSFLRRCLLTKQAAMVLKRTAAAKKQMVATIPATTGRASPRSSTNSGGGKKSEGEERGRQKHNEVEQQIHGRNRALYSRYADREETSQQRNVPIFVCSLNSWTSFIIYAIVSIQFVAPKQRLIFTTQMWVYW